MNNPLVIDVGLHWAAVVVYSIATWINTWGVIFKKEKPERIGYLVAYAGMVIHGSAILFRWYIAGHGPYMAQYETLSANAFFGLAMFFFFVRRFPTIRPASIIVFPIAFFLIALTLFTNPEMDTLPPTLNSPWLVLHVLCFNIALATLTIGLAFSLFCLFRDKQYSFRWLDRLPDDAMLDIYAYRFATFGFVFWTSAVLAGALWGYQAWGRFWAWDPMETSSLITWAAFGIYLHLRKFFHWKGVKAAWLFMICYLFSVLTAFIVPLVRATAHAEYFQ